MLTFMTQNYSECRRSRVPRPLPTRSFSPVLASGSGSGPLGPRRLAGRAPGWALASLCAHWTASVRIVRELTAEPACLGSGAALDTVQTPGAPQLRGGEGPQEEGERVWQKGHPCAEFKSEESNFEKVSRCIK